jgi:DNA polymerase-3 subunit gamma/tau
VGKNRDVMEENCADNSGIDDIRSIIEERLRVAPTIGQYRIFILDEVQRLSKDAQGAMLKHLEEPPSYVKFILCTTDPEKLLPALLTRCQRQVLKPLNDSNLISLLRSVSKEEGIEFDDEGLQMIAESAQGSARQALVYLEHAATIGSATSETVAQVLGRGPIGFCRDMLISVIDCDDISILKMLDVIKTDGLDRNAIASECLRLLMAVQKAKSLEDSLENNSILLPLSLKYKKSGINVVAQYLVEAITHMRGGVVDDAVLQMNLLRASEYIKNKRAEAMAKKSVQ